MPIRFTIPLIVDLILIDNSGQMRELNEHPNIGRDLSAGGGLIPWLIRRRINRALVAGGELLPAFLDRENVERAESQQDLEKRLTGFARDLRPLRREVEQLAQYVCGAPLDARVGEVVQQAVGRLFVDHYRATADSYRAARDLAKWLSLDPLRALWWTVTGRLQRSRRIIWDLAGQDPQCIHATALAMHNIVDALRNMREFARDAVRRRSRSADEIVAASLVAPTMLLRACRKETRVSFLSRPLRRGSLILFRLRRIHAATGHTDLAFARGAWSQCPAHVIVPALLNEVWRRAREGEAPAVAARARRRTWRPSLPERLLTRAVGVLIRPPWHRYQGRLGKWLGVLNLAAFRFTLRERNLYDTTPDTGLADPGKPWEAPFLHYRAADGVFNDLEEPAMGGAGTHFGRNVPLEAVRPEVPPGLYQPNPREISLALLTRKEFIPATSLNLLVAAWLQFQIHDWFSHELEDDPALEIPRVAGDNRWPDRHMRVRRTRQAPAQCPAHATGPPAYRNKVTHWWDASQLYGSTLRVQCKVRCGTHGKLKIENGLLPVDPDTRFDLTGSSENWWLGLSLLHTLFTLEHNAICDRLRQEFPFWSDEQLFQTARLVNAGLLAKIHTTEWTPAILAHPAVITGMHGNWWGLLGQRTATLLGRVSDREEVSGIPGSPTDHHRAAYAITEEFVSVYRMHPLLPDRFIFYSVADGQRIDGADLLDAVFEKARPIVENIPMPDLFYSFGIAHPGALVLHNYPAVLQELRPPDGLRIDLAAIDILRDRERGVPRYNEFRRRLGRGPVTFDELTDNPRWADELRQVYANDVEQVDLMVGLFAEKRPPGFGFSDTAFRIFVLMASRRLKSDRFFTRDYTPAIYTQAGLDWIHRNNMKSVLLRHYPSLAPAIVHVPNVFGPWDHIR